MAQNKHVSSGEQQVDVLLQTYPRLRPTLAPEYERIFVDHYRSNRSTSGLNGLVARLEAWMHKCVAAAANPAATVLEIGAGSLNHVPHECPARIYDVVEPFRALWEDSPHRNAVHKIYGDISEIPDGVRYDRIVSVAVLEHLTCLPAIVARCGTMLADGGLFQAGIPTEGGKLWGAAWRSTTGVVFRLKRRLPYAPVMQHEHLNTAAEIETVVGYLFREVSVKRFPLRWRHLSFYTYIAAREPRLDRCHRLVQNNRAER